jgi:hypothetical protein
MSMNALNDLSKVYLEQIASVDEAVKGQDTEMRKAASAERSAERKQMGGRAAKIPGREGPSAGKTYADYQQISIKSHDKLTKKNKDIVGLVAKEETALHRDAKTGEVVSKAEVGKTYYPAQKMKKTSVALEKEKKATNEALDPVGQEDADIDNDGKKNTKSDKYLLNRRKVRGAAIATRKEGFSNWRQDLSEVISDVVNDRENDTEIKEKKIKNKIEINPDFKEAVEEIGGQLIEMVEVDEAYQPIDRKKESAMYRRAGNLARTALSSRGKKKEVAQTKSSKIVSAITRQKEKERFDRIGQSPLHNEEVEIDEASYSAKAARAGKDIGKPGKAFSKIASSAAKRYGSKAAGERVAGAILKNLRKEEIEILEDILDERTLTAPEAKKKEEIVKSMKKNLSGFKSRYGARAKEVMYATATKQAKKVAEDTTPTQTSTPVIASATPKVDPVNASRQKQLVAIQKKQTMDRLAQLNKGVPITSESTASDALALVRASVAKQHGAASIVGSAANKRAQASQPKSEKPKRKLQGYSIPGAPPEKSYND